MSNQSIAKFIYKSIKNKLSYDKMAEMEYIPFSPHDFYGYQRKCMFHLRNKLIEKGRWR